MLLTSMPIKADSNSNTIENMPVIQNLEGYYHKYFIVPEHFVDNIGTWKKENYASFRNTILVGASNSKPAETTSAATTVQILESGKYYVWVRGRDFSTNSPGTRYFRVSINGIFLNEAFGDHGYEGWAWEKSGPIYLNSGEATISLIDTSAQYARMNCIIITNDPDFVPDNSSYDKLKADLAVNKIKPGDQDDIFVEEYPPYNPNGNLFSNGDISNGRTNWEYNNTITSGGVTERYGVFHFDGGNILINVNKFHNTDRNGLRLQYTNVPLEANKIYKVSFWVKSSETVVFRQVSSNDTEYKNNPQLGTGNGNLLIRVMKDNSTTLTNSEGKNVEYHFNITGQNKEQTTFEKNKWKKVVCTLDTSNCNITEGNKFIIRFYFGGGYIVGEDGVARRQKADGGTFTIILDNFEIREVVNLELEAEGVDAADADVVKLTAIEVENEGYVAKGEEITLKAAVKEGAKYVFEKWVNENGDFISNDPMPKVTINGSSKFKAVFKKMPNYEVQVSTNNNSFGTVSAQKQGPYQYGEEVTLTAVANSGYKFMYWEDNGKIVSSSNQYVLKVRGNHNIKAHFASTGGHTVVFKDPSGRIIKIESVTNGTATEPSEAEKFKPGYEFERWNKELTNITGNTEIIAIYKQPDLTYSVSISGGKGKINGGQSSGLFKFDDPVTVSPSTTEGFSYWKDGATNEILSYNPEYKFYVSKNITLVPVYGEFLVNRRPVAVINSVIKDSDTVSFVAQCTVPSNGEYTIVEYGVLLSDTNSSPTLVDSDVIRGRAGSMTDSGQFMITKTNTGGKTWYGRAYVICKDSSGSLIIIYSDVKN